MLQGKKQTEIANKINTSQTQVSRLEKKIKKKLKVLVEKVEE